MKRIMYLKLVPGLVMMALIALSMGLTSTSALAVPIVFNLGFGGTVSYGGGVTPLVTTNGTVLSASNGTDTVSISNGDLDFSTGNYTGGSATPAGFENHYAPGGTINISGDIGGGVVALLTGSFTDDSTFSCCSGGSQAYVSSFNGLLNVSYLDPNLAALLGFVLPPTGGGIGQVEIFFGALPPQGPGVAFNGTQGGGAVNVTDTVSVVPEPTTLLLLGSGLVGLGLWRRKRNI